MDVLTVRSFVFYAVALVLLSSCGDGSGVDKFSHELLNNTDQVDQFWNHRL